MALNAVELEIISRKLAAVTDEMYFAIQRASRSAYVKEAADFATAILDPEGNVFAYPPSATFAFLVDCNFATTIKAVPNVEPGDVIITNDPYLSEGLATHLPDINLLRPIFHEGRLIAYAWSFVHCADIGGAVPSSMSPALTEIFQEGLRIPPMKLFKAGVVNDDLLAMIRLNSRVPDVTIADLRAMAGALALGEVRLGELISQVGLTQFEKSVADVQDYAEARARDVLRRIPDGDYEFWDFMDDDMISRVPVRVRVKMSVRDGLVNLDVTGTDPQVKSAYNMPSAGKRMHWLTFRLTGFITAFDGDIPKNAGIYRNMTVTNPPGTVLNAEFPDAVNLRVSAPYRLFDSIGGALIKAVPELMPAATGGTMSPFSFAETLEDGSRKVEVVQPMRCGMGAMAGRDGTDARDNSLNNMRNHPIETVEGYSALVVTAYDIRPDSGGPGKWRGGVGQMITVRSATDSGVVVARGMERLRFQPFGIFGGQPGQTLQAWVNKGRPDERQIAKIHELYLSRGETLTILMPGGGGYGDPFERDVQAVLDDVLDGFVTVAAAARDYGVVITDGVVDQAATEALRATAVRPEVTGDFSFGAFREHWEAIFDDATMLDLNQRLFALPKSVRHITRRRIFEAAVPELAEMGLADLTPALTNPALTRARLLDAMDQLLPTPTRTL